MGIERRKFARVPVYMKIVNESSEYDIGFGYAKDISTGGMALDIKVGRGPKRPKAGDAMRLKFKIPSGKLYVTVDAHVTRIDSGSEGSMMIGLRFINIQEDQAKEIEKFVEATRKGDLVIE